MACARVPEDNLASLVSQVSLDPSSQTFNEPINTSKGVFNVEIIGDRENPAIITLHDIALNASTAFNTFLDSAPQLITTYCFYNINIIGHESYNDQMVAVPSMTSLVKVIEEILEHLKIRRFIGLAMGAGAYLMQMYTLKNPASVQSMILCNATIETATAEDHVFFNKILDQLEKVGMTEDVDDHLWSYFCGDLSREKIPDLAEQMTEKFCSLNPSNMGGYIRAFLERPPLQLSSDSKFSCPILLICGGKSPFLDKSVKLANTCNSPKVTLYQMAFSYLPLEENSSQVADVVVSFLRFGDQ